MHGEHCMLVCIHEKLSSSVHDIHALLLTTLTSGPNFCMIVAENAAPANNGR